VTNHQFISYSSVDAEDFVIRLYNELKAGPPSIPVWLDKRDIKPGQDWDKQIAEAIRTCDNLIFVMTHDSVEDRSVCKPEWTRALKYKKPIIPVLLHADADIPFRLENRQHINFTDDFNIALAELRNHLEWLGSPKGVLQAYKNLLEDAQRDLRRAQDPVRKVRIETDIAELEKQISEQQRIVNYSSNNRVECSACRNLITESNKSLICTGCGAQFCETCEEWFRDERKRGDGTLCNNCYIADQELLREVAKRKAKIEHEREERLERKRKEKEQEEERLKAEQEKKTQEKFVKEGNSVGMKFTHIPAGEFMIGSDEYSFEKPVHKVNIDKPFYLGIYPVTQREWKAVMRDDPSKFKGDDLPVEFVSWDDAQEFIKKLNEKEGTDKYRLPSEAEWEYAARAGTTTKYCYGDDESRLGDYAWYMENSGSRSPKKGDYFGYDKDDWFSNDWNGKTHTVGQKKPNQWGLYDMSGNVWEWVQDEWHDDYEGAPIDGNAWGDGNGPRRVSRGGSWFSIAVRCRSANRGGDDPGNRYFSLGVRLLKEL